MFMQEVSKRREKETVLRVKREEKLKIEREKLEQEKKAEAHRRYKRMVGLGLMGTDKWTTTRTPERTFLSLRH